MAQQTSENVSTVQSPLAFSAQQLADRLGVSLRHIRRLDSAGKLPKPIRLGRSVRWPVQEVEAFLAAGAPDRQRWQTMKGTTR
ncbi:MAG: helix-turn-helix domain-containing protein [Phycisphaerae bacterium]|nr:helix-turn-helix domain-containing protein [Phycisphaerae bacterium]